MHKFLDALKKIGTAREKSARNVKNRRGYCASLFIDRYALQICCMPRRFCLYARLFFVCCAEFLYAILAGAVVQQWRAGLLITGSLVRTYSGASLVINFAPASAWPSLA